MKTKEYDLFFARLVRNDHGWRFTLWEIYTQPEEPSWCLLYLAWHPHPETRRQTLRMQFCR